ncbi:MAG: cysteine desulfurase [Acidobacteria bacterium]|nr:cysteine desulfurase [Acidobacteriota bacterium]MDW7983599.1 cysteine desulfurase [Acidobacteriota bacterium]
MQETRPVGGLDAKALRTDFPIFRREVHGRRLVYLDNAATSQRPQAVIDAVRQFYECSNANIHRAVHTLSHEATVAYEEAHKKVARFVGARSWREIIFVRNATEAMNLVAHAWGLWNLREGDEVVLTIMEHHSNIVPWHFLRKLRGIRLHFVDVDDSGQLRLDQYYDLLERPRVRLAAFTMASNVLGTVNPVQEMVRAARERGIVTLVDAAQGAPHLPIDVQTLGCDFLAASGHKMLGPTGSGFLYAREEILQTMEPFLYGGDMISKVTTEGAEWNELPWKYEAGTPHIAGGIGLGAAVDYLMHLGMDRVYEHERHLLAYALERLQSIPGIRLYGPEEGPRLGVVSFTFEKAHPHDVAHILDEHGVAVRSGHHCAQPLMKRLGMDNTVRASLYIYNDEADVDALVEALQKVVRIFKIR